jgi:tetratricopeptide (TPR) repeat protein
MLVPRCNGAAFVEELFKALDDISSALRERIFGALRKLPLELRLIVDKVWLAEAEKSQPDWPRVIALFRQINRYGEKWNIPELRIAASKAVALVNDEYLNNQDAALAELDKARDTEHLDSYLLDDQRAATLFHAGRKGEALRSWEEAFARWPEAVEPHDATAGLSARIAGMAAADLGDWHEAAIWFGRGVAKVPTESFNLPLIAGLLTDAAFAYWRAAANEECLKALSHALVTVDKLPTGKQDLSAFKARKLFGHVLMWIDNSLYNIGHHQFVEPKAGLCSSPETAEKMRELPDNDPDVFPVMLLRIALRVGHDSGLLEWLQPRLEAMQSYAPRVLYRDALIRRALQRADVSELPRLVDDYLLESHEAREKLRPDHPGHGLTLPNRCEFPLNDAMLGATVFLSAMVALAGAGRSCLDCIVAWRANAQTLPARNPIEQWLQEVERVFHQNPALSEAMLRTGGRDRNEHLLAALHIATTSEASPAQLLRAHTFLLCEMPSMPWFLHIEQAFAQMITSGWHRAAKSPFALVNPRAGLGDLRKELDGQAPGLVKAARVIRAAIPLVGLRVHKQIIEQIQKYAGDKAGNSEE